MMAFPSMLVPAAKAAKMKVPRNPDKYDKKKYPHFHVFCTVQLGRRMRPGEQWGNAKVVASVPKDQILKVTLTDLIAKGLEWAT